MTVLVLGAHLLLSAGIASAMAWEFGSGPRTVSTHVLLIAEWDFTLLAVLCAFAAIGAPARIRVPCRTYRFLLAVTCTLQVYLYALNIDQQPFVGPQHDGPSRVGVRADGVVGKGTVSGWAVRHQCVCGRNALADVGCLRTAGSVHRRRGGRVVEEGISFQTRPCPANSRDGRRHGRALLAPPSGPASPAATTCSGKTNWFPASSGLKVLPLSRPRAAMPWPSETLCFARRTRGLFLERAARMSSSSSSTRCAPTACRSTAISVRRRHFCRQLVDSGRMKKVEAAFSTCSESFCGITSTLSQPRVSGHQRGNVSTAGRACRRGL